MGGIITNTGLSDDQTLTPAPDVPPESYLSQDAMNQSISAVAALIGGDPLVKDLMVTAQQEGYTGVIAWLAKNVGALIALIIQSAAPILVPIGQGIVTAITPAIAGIGDIFGTLSASYVAEVTRHYSMEAGGATKSSGTPMGNAAQAAFDSIVAPISFFTSGSDPSTDGAGTRNLQQTLGVIVQLHLITWVINVVSNLTGIGALHYINSFNEVLLAALNTRALSRVAMRPYLNTMIVEPITGELNTKWPLKSPAASSDIKQYIRNGITADQLRVNMAKLGYNADVTAQLLLDTAPAEGVRWEPQNSLTRRVTSG